MHNADWSEELKDLERRLAARARSEPDPALRVWVVTALTREARAAERESFWNFVVGLAAVFFLGANLTMSSAPLVNVNLTDDPEGVATAARRLHALLPEITAEAAYAEVLLASSWSRLPMVPNMGAGPSIVRPGKATGLSRRKMRTL
jgi:hypothetical protein